MPKCKICGEEARSGEVLHSACREERAAEILQVICDEYCKHVPFSSSEEELEEECAKCKIAEMLGYK